MGEGESNRPKNKKKKTCRHQRKKIDIITLPLRTALAADNSACGTTPFSAPNVFTTADSTDGTDMPWEFSARTMKTYEVAGFNSLICRVGYRNIIYRDVVWPHTGSNYYYII